MQQQVHRILLVYSAVSVRVSAMQINKGDTIVFTDGRKKIVIAVDLGTVALAGSVIRKHSDDLGVGVIMLHPHNRIHIGIRHGGGLQLQLVRDQGNEFCGRS